MSLDSLVELFQNHQFLAIAIFVVFGIIVYKKPKPMFQLMGAVLVVGAIGYVVSFLVHLTSTGIDHNEFLYGQSGKIKKGETAPPIVKLPWVSNY